MVLADDNLRHTSMSAAVAEGRTILSNVRRKYLRYLLALQHRAKLLDDRGSRRSARQNVHRADGARMAAGVVPRASAARDPDPLDQPRHRRRAGVSPFGLDPADAGTMNKPPRPRDGGVTRAWAGFCFGRVVMAVAVQCSTLPPGGSDRGRRRDSLRQTDLHDATCCSALQRLQPPLRHVDASGRSGRRLWAAVALSLALQAAVVYLRFLQVAFSTVALSLRDWIWCAAVSSSVLWLREISKAVARAREA